MKKEIFAGLLSIFFLVSIAAAQPGPWKSNSGNPQVIDPGTGETWLKMDTGDGGFQLWITGDREWHCVYKPEGQNSGNGWTPSTTFPGYVYKCNEYKA